MLKVQLLSFYVLVILLSEIIYLQHLWLGNCKSNIFYIVIFAQLLKYFNKKLYGVGLG